MKTPLLLGPALICLAFCDVASAQPKAKRYFPPPAVFCLALSPDGKTLALAERTLSVRLWHVAERKDIRSFPIGGTRESYISSLTFSPDGKTLAVAGSGRLEVWDIETGKLRMTFKNGVKGFVNRMVLGNDGAFRVVKEAIVRPDDVRCAKFSADGKILFSGGKENVIRLWDPATGKEKAKWTGHKDAATHLALSGDGKTLASGTFNREIKVWDVAKQKEIASFENGRSVYGLALSADGKKLLASNGVEVILWDVAKKELLGSFKGAKFNTNRAAFSPDGKLVVAQAVDFMVWDANTFAHLATLERSLVFGFAITPDSRTLLTCDEKGNVKAHELPRVK